MILICEEDKLQEAADKDELKVAYKDFKEKLVGQTFSLNVDYAAIAGSFIQATDSKLQNGTGKKIAGKFGDLSNNVYFCKMK